MKGLLCKDLTELLSPVNLIPAAVAMLAGMILKLPYLFACIALFIAVMPADSMRRDAVSRWETQQMMLPVSRFCIVTEKYLLTLICAAAAVLLTGLGMLWIAPAYQLDSEELLLWVMRACLCCLLIPALVCPVSFRFGYDKGRGILFLLIVFFAVVTASELAVPETEFGTVYAKLLSSISLSSMTLKDILRILLHGGSYKMILISVFCTLILTFVSWLLSLWGFCRREF